ncbi:MAG TPA: type II toxin-antitoxin system HicA family toxin [Pirellulaceae bacterium]|nr:type II toxin-antitoxin system HicA family toxin [Pirellulaceae bacterium]
MPRIPGVNHLDAVRALEKAGFRIIRQGKHIVMSDGNRQVTIPRHNPIKACHLIGMGWSFSSIAS